MGILPKPKYVDSSGIVIRANQFPLSRVQNLSLNIDPNTAVLEEGGNFAPADIGITDFSGKLSVVTKDYGSLRHIRILVTDTGEDHVTNLTPEWFENAAVDLTLDIHPDSRDARVDGEIFLKKGLHMQDAFLDSISWNYSVDGMSTETFNFSFNEARWYTNDYRDIIVGIGFNPAHDSDGNASVTINQRTIGTAKDLLALYIDGQLVTGVVTETNNGSSLPFNAGAITCGLLEWTDTNFTTTGSRYRALFYRTGGINDPGVRPPVLIPSGVNAGQVGRGHINIYLTSGDGDLDALSAGLSNWLRLQSADVSIDFNRGTISEMGNYKPVERPMGYPLRIQINSTAYATDLEDLCKLTTYDYLNDNTINLLSGFTISGQFRIDIYDKDDRFQNDRILLKRLTVTGLRLISTAQAVSVGGKSTIDIQLEGTHFALSGYGIMGSGLDMFPDSSAYAPTY